MSDREFTTIAFKSDGRVGVNLAGCRRADGRVSLIRCYQTPYSDLMKRPECFELTAEDARLLQEWLVATKGTEE